MMTLLILTEIASFPAFGMNLTVAIVRMSSFHPIHLTVLTNGENEGLHRREETCCAGGYRVECCAGEAREKDRSGRLQKYGNERTYMTIATPFLPTEARGAQRTSSLFSFAGRPCLVGRGRLWQTKNVRPFGDNPTSVFPLGEEVSCPSPSPDGQEGQSPRALCFSAAKGFSKPASHRWAV